MALGNGNCLVCGFCDSCSLQSGNSNNFTAKFLFQLINMYCITVFLNDIHHVDCHDDRNPKFQNLCCKIQVTFNIGTINDIDDRIRFFLKNVISCNYFFKCIW